jgi:hypothetical protein
MGTMIWGSFAERECEEGEKGRRGEGEREG